MKVCFDDVKVARFKCFELFLQVEDLIQVLRKLGLLDDAATLEVF